MRLTTIISNALIAFSALLSAGCNAQSPTPADTNKELDFMVGEWEADAKIKVSPTDYITGKGSIKVYYKENILLADMNIKFDNFDVIGTTKRIFKPERKLWEISWNPVDGQGAVPDIEGRMRDGRFIEFDYGKDANGPYVGRLVIYDISNDHFSVRKDQLYDNGALAKEIWVYEANRKK